jgi:hypothetical protein
MAVAFKEWALVCEALRSGRQSVILRKGGIAEGRDGFAFKHRDFLLFPTWFHEQLEKTKLQPETPIPAQLEGEVEISCAATLEWTHLVRDPSLLEGLRDFHILQDSVVRERFSYGGEAGLHVGFVRVFRIDPPVRLAMRSSFGGCRTWVEVPGFDDAALVSVISDEEHERRDGALRRLLGLEDTPRLTA